MTNEIIKQRGENQQFSHEDFGLTKYTGTGVDVVIPAGVTHMGPRYSMIAPDN